MSLVGEEPTQLRRRLLHELYRPDDAANTGDHLDPWLNDRARLDECPY